MSLLDILKPKIQEEYPNKKLIFTISMYFNPTDREGYFQPLWSVRFAEEHPSHIDTIIGVEAKNCAVKVHDEIITFVDNHSPNQVKDFVVLMYQGDTLEEAFQKVEGRTKNGEYKDIKSS